MKSLSISRAIKLMFIIGVIAVFSVAVQSCQSSKDDNIIRLSEKKLEITQFRTGSLHKLQALDAPPAQPQTRFVNGKGETMSLANFKGQFVLLNVWATWCAPCVIEMPSLNTLSGQYSSDDFTVVTISMDQTDAAIETFFKKNDLSNLTQWRDPDLNLAPKLNARGLPITVIYNPAGDEIARVSGEADWASEEAKKLIEAVLRK